MLIEPHHVRFVKDLRVHRRADVTQNTIILKVQMKQGMSKKEKNSLKLENTVWTDLRKMQLFLNIRSKVEGK